MKLRYKVMHETTVEPQVLMARIISFLTEQDYIIKEKTIKTISFKDDKWKIRSKNKIFSKVDGGKFELEDSSKGYVITFTYYLSFLFEFMATVFILLIVSIVHNYFIMVIAIPLFIQLVYRILNLKEETGEMIKRIASVP